MAMGIVCKRVECSKRITAHTYKNLITPCHNLQIQKAPSQSRSSPFSIPEQRMEFLLCCTKLSFVQLAKIVQGRKALVWVPDMEGSVTKRKQVGTRIWRAWQATARDLNLILWAVMSSFRDLRQEEDPKLIGMVYSKDPGCQNSQIPTFSSSNQESNAG